MKNSTKRIIMENLPLSQDRVALDTLVNNVFSDSKHLYKSVELYDIYCEVKELHESQDLFIFGDGLVAATRKGLAKYN